MSESGYIQSSYLTLIRLGATLMRTIWPLRVTRISIVFLYSLEGVILKDMLIFTASPR